jgi:hypothetical protein
MFMECEDAFAGGSAFDADDVLVALIAIPLIAEPLDAVVVAAAVAGLDAGTTAAVNGIRMTAMTVATAAIGRAAMSRVAGVGS